MVWLIPLFLFLGIAAVVNLCAIGLVAGAARGKLVG